ncbi:MAG: isoaspartyl peptidase/L-asparaginase [Bdellovibrionota bacterium]
MNNKQISVILHGGAGRFSEKYTPNKLPFLKQALDAAWDALTAGRTGGIAVTQALKVMEECEFFNAGYGGYPNANGIVLLDIGLMRGNRDFISLLNLRRVKVPSAVAYDMLERHSNLMSVWTHELMLELEAAPEFIKQRYGYVARHEDLLAPYVLELLKDKNAAEVAQDGGTHGTVGCVVRDADGNLFAGTSTGGVNLKYNGRIGDTPIIGQGVFADNEIGALSTTGHGESLMLSCLSGFILAEMRARIRKNKYVFSEDPSSLSDLLAAEMREMSRKTSNGGAIVIIPNSGLPQYAFNSEMVSIALRSGSAEKINLEECCIALSSGDKITSN